MCTSGPGRRRRVRHGRGDVRYRHAAHFDHLVSERSLSREEAYVLCCVCADLKISEIVDSPNRLVSAFLPETVFV